METLVTHPYSLGNMYLLGIWWLDKAFTLSVQSKCANCTSVYKGAYPEGFQMQMVVAHGGWCAERVVFGDEITDGGKDYLEKIMKVIVLNINLL